MAVVALAIGLTACADSNEDGGASSSGSPLSGRVTVFAAASLTEPFRAMGEAFTRQNPGVTVQFNFASSSALATQIEQAAPADVFASADQAQMRRLVDAMLIEGAPVTFARNVPVIVVPADNRAGITSPKDLARPGVKLVLAARDVPIGSYAREIIDRLATDPAYGSSFRDAVLKNVVSNEANVRAVLAKIELGEGDAGIVYQTDALVSKDEVRIIALPDGAMVSASYPIAVVKGTKNGAVAEAFVTFVRGAEAQTVLARAGFGMVP